MPLQAFLVINPLAQDIQLAIAGIPRSQQQLPHRYRRRDHQKAAVFVLRPPGLARPDAVLAALALGEPAPAQTLVGWAGFPVLVRRLRLTLGFSPALSPAPKQNCFATTRQAMLMRLQPAKPVYGWPPAGYWSVFQERPGA